MTCISTKVLQVRLGKTTFAETTGNGLDKDVLLPTVAQLDTKVCQRRNGMMDCSGFANPAHVRRSHKPRFVVMTRGQHLVNNRCFKSRGTAGSRSESVFGQHNSQLTTVALFET